MNQWMNISRQWKKGKVSLTWKHKTQNILSISKSFKIKKNLTLYSISDSIESNLHKSSKTSQTVETEERIN